ncbi:uncharacterized protein BDR25DRAFT_305454 [Lindgomyces ingoldianus]|uniref:Uncharacterized protein n=1 Tax=Lindgomyces ingoldianus TaxID=673940 RepID=A0ACB6QL23_9PLEO|nr:uncharacterized protein BDR25DRAFT_305454 [Lindgomyces ingoldianus]KAF2467714.1 hypothetical protein BDR25DRAFT_305454 [Lindgomyces ingoldianus]
MATGVETAGLVLGSIPLILAGLEFYMKGIAVTKRCFKYREQFNSLIDELRTENAICTNSINLLLVGIVKQKDMAEFLVDPCGDRWKEAKFDRKLKQRLGASYESYMATVSELSRAAQAFKQRLKLNPSGKPQFADEMAFKECFKRLKFSLKKCDYDDLMARLRRANSSLHRLTTQTISLESLQSSCKSDGRSIPNFNAIHDRAKGFHFALRSGWKCPCHADHTVNLRLEPRMDDAQSDDSSDEDEEYDAMRDSFHVVFCNGHEELLKSTSSPTVAKKPWTWEEADVHITLEKKSSSDTPSAAVKAGAGGGKGVRFACQAKKAVKAALDPTPNLQPIQDLCAAICTLQKLHRTVCLSLLENEYNRQKYGILIYPLKERPSDTEAWSIASLRSVLQDPGFARRDRLQLAVTLASSVLQLHETPWLDESWGMDDILFIKRTGKAAYGHPFVTQRYDQATQIPSNPMPASMRRIIRNQTLYALGISLIELWYGKTMSDLRKPEDGALGNGSADIMAQWNTADRLVDELYNDAGGKYSDAVRRCIRCDFDQRASSLEDAAFQKAVFQGVVAQLKENFDFLYWQDVPVAHDEAG